MTTAAWEPRGRHRQPPPDAPARARLSRSTWRGLQLSLTAGLFVVATISGVSVGLGGAVVSPVAPAAAAVVAAPNDPAPADPAAQAVAMPADSGAHSHGHHR